MDGEAVRNRKLVYGWIIEEPVHKENGSEEKDMSYIYEEFDGASCHCKCKWCGYKGMVDSQGNLF